MKPCTRRPRIAVVSPWPPQASGVADYASRLVNELRCEYDIDAYHDPANPPDQTVLRDGVTSIPAPLLPRLIGLRGYRTILYQMGNSRYHAFLYPLMLSHPGIVTLHDLRLTNFHETFSARPDVPRDHLVREIAHDRPRESSSLLRDLPSMRTERGGIPVALAVRGIDLNRRVFESSKAAVVHSRWSRDRAISLMPEYADKVSRVPFGATPELVTTEQKTAIRLRLGIPSNAIVFASLGFLGWGKMNEEAITAFSEIVKEEPAALLAFAGKDLDEGRAARKAHDLGISHRVRFLESTTDSDLCDLARASDIGVNLRRTPTSGETSGTLFTFLRLGIPTIVTDIDSFQDEPDEVVVRIRWQDEGMSGLIEAMQQLVLDRPKLERIGLVAHRHIVKEHCWPDVASRYMTLIEQSSRRQTVA